MFRLLHQSWWQQHRPIMLGRDFMADGDIIILTSAADGDTDEVMVVTGAAADTGTAND